MTRQSEKPFDSIESAYDFFCILSEAVAEARRDIEADVQREANAQSSRRLDALRVVCYSVEKLGFHVQRSRRILNDLRSLRRLLFEERVTPKVSITAQPVPADRLAVSLPAQLKFPRAQVRARGKSVVAV